MERNRTTMKITTTYIPATDTSGAKIRARGLGKQATIPYPYELDTTAAHRMAADVLAERLGRAVADPDDMACLGYSESRTGHGYRFELD